jgi:hypothetical protein
MEQGLEVKKAAIATGLIGLREPFWASGAAIRAIV